MYKPSRGVGGKYLRELALVTDTRSQLTAKMGAGAGAQLSTAFPSDIDDDNHNGDCCDERELGDRASRDASARLIYIDPLAPVEYSYKGTIIYERGTDFQVDLQMPILVNTKAKSFTIRTKKLSYKFIAQPPYTNEDWVNSIQEAFGLKTCDVK